MSDLDRKIKDSIREALESKTETSPKQTPQSPVEPQHNFHTWDKKCKDCGESNPNYKQPNVYCSDCGNPLGTIKSDDPESGKSIPSCSNCGSSKGVFHEFNPSSDDDDSDEYRDSGDWWND